MISVGIDISKEKSTVCILRQYGEVVSRPFEIAHNEHDLEELTTMLKRFDDEVKVILEATGIYHLPVLTYLQKQEIFVSVINPYHMKKYRCQGIRRGKTDKLDSITIACYGIEHWNKLNNFIGSSEIYAELRILCKQYQHYINQHIDGLLDLTHLLDYTMPGVKNIMSSFCEYTGKDKLSDFAEKYWHFDNIKAFKLEDFIEDYNKWAKEKGYQQDQDKALQIYDLAMRGIPTLSSTKTSTKMLIEEAVRVQKGIDATLVKILTRMQEIARTLPEYSIVREMAGVGDILSVKLIAEIGDVRRFHSARALVAYAGIDAPPYQSGKFNALNRRISKRGSSLLRKIGYEVMMSLKMHSYPNDPVYNFILKKESEGKPKRVCKIAGLNKFLRIYYARVKEVYKEA